ncbi:serine hydrolase domain-containing protein [Stenotrophomonas bentonitica]|uniref:serine hydrolase domain-containing protein n=1 Tax=Stenotrophomonas bentonitica TaxID=1450134 RepID=UPI00345E4614
MAAGSPAFAPMLDSTVEQYRLPGIAMAVVENGEVVFTGTRGERGGAIDADTHFRIASNSKAMTAAVLARLVDRGRVAWDDPVIKHLPQFRMFDPWVTEHMQVRDLLIHNSGLGLGAGDLMLWPEPNQYTRADIIAGLAHLKPVTSFRSGYAYDNLMYVVAGEVAAAAGGKPIDQLLREEVFAPLGMAGCQAPAELTSLAAGGIRCSLRDMTRWMQVLLDPKLAPGWLSDTQRRALWTAHMPMPLGERQRAWDNAHFSAYGYGWRLSDLDGQWKVAHTGTLSGSYSSLAMLPDRKVGVVILIDGEGEDARTVLMQAALKQYTAPEQKQTVASYAAQLRTPVEPRPAWLRGAAHPVSTDHPAATQGVALPTSVPSPPSPPTGLYRDPWLGQARLCPENGRLRFTVDKSPTLRGTVMQLDTRWLVQWDTLGADAEPWLQVEPGSPPALTLRAIDPDIDFSYDFQDLHFTRTGDCP